MLLRALSLGPSIEQVALLTHLEMTHHGRVNRLVGDSRSVYGLAVACQSQVVRIVTDFLLQLLLRLKGALFQILGQETTLTSDCWTQMLSLCCERLNLIRFYHLNGVCVVNAFVSPLEITYSIEVVASPLKVLRPQDLVHLIFVDLSKSAQAVVMTKAKSCRAVQVINSREALKGLIHVVRIIHKAICKRLLHVAETHSSTQTRDLSLFL